jgi:hypothetical protein
MRRARSLDRGGSLIILHGQESRAELVILYPQAKVVHTKIGCGVIGASETVRGMRGDRGPGGMTVGVAISQMAQP